MKAENFELANILAMQAAEKIAKLLDVPASMIFLNWHLSVPRKLFDYIPSAERVTEQYTYKVVYLTNGNAVYAFVKDSD